jgi:hypothetical protein
MVVTTIPIQTHRDQMPKALTILPAYAGAKQMAANATRCIIKGMMGWHFEWEYAGMNRNTAISCVSLNIFFLLIDVVFHALLFELMLATGGGSVANILRSLR